MADQIAISRSRSANHRRTNCEVVVEGRKEMVCLVTGPHMIETIQHQVIHILTA